MKLGDVEFLVSSRDDLAGGFIARSKDGRRRILATKAGAHTICAWFEVPGPMTEDAVRTVMAAAREEAMQTRLQ